MKRLLLASSFIVLRPALEATFLGARPEALSYYPITSRCARQAFTHAGFRPPPWLERIKIPFEIPRQPAPPSKTRVPLSAISPGRRHLGYTVAAEETLDRDLQIHLKTSLALDSHGIQHGTIVDLEGVRGIVGGYATKPAQGDTRRARERLLKARRIYQ